MWAGVPEYQTGLGTGLRKWKSHLQLSWGPGEPGPWRALPAPPLELLSCNLRMACASRSCLRELAALRAGQRGIRRTGGARPQVKPPLPPTSSAQTFPGCPSQRQHPGTPMADPALILNASCFSLCTSHATSPAPKAGDSESLLALKPPQYPHAWPCPGLCPLHHSLGSSNRRPLRGPCPPHGTLSPGPSRPALCSWPGQADGGI